ncbi:MAG: nucleoside triphosphate pyrophosphohydrolase [Verrucomicrobiae bacterium]|nr:nucleoside triphosphate pyrophosphohydrolase [Verrucomicrobiae bacterium]
MKTQTKNLIRLLRIVQQLRAPNGCPWDRKQTHLSLRQNLIEESHEAADALGRADYNAFRDELGDLLLQIVLHAQIAAEKNRFTFDDVARSIADKLLRRHPHVFGNRKLRTSTAVLRQWETIKRTENQSPSVLTNLPTSLPALLKAEKVQRKVARLGFDWRRSRDVLAKIEEELHELRQAMKRRCRKQLKEELGDLLFAVVNLARFEGFQAEEVLNRAVDKFIHRFRKIEQQLHANGKRPEQCTLQELDALWESTKRTLKPSARPCKRAARARSL